MRECIDIADAIVNQLNSAPDGTFGHGFTAERTVLPEYELSDLTSLKVSVVPAEVEIARSSRASSQYEFAIDIGIQKKVADVEQDVLALSQLVSQVVEYLTSSQLTTAPYAIFKQISNAPVYSPEMLRDRRVFISVVRVIYTAIK